MPPGLSTTSSSSSSKTIRIVAVSQTIAARLLLILCFPHVSFLVEAVTMKSAGSIGQYLIQRLHSHGVRHVFGIPGDYVLGFYDQLLHSRLKIINTCDEQGAGFAADAYARVRGLGAVCITYCVG